MRRLRRGLAAGLLVIGVAWGAAITDVLSRHNAGEGVPAWQPARSYAGAVEISGAVSRPGVRPGLAGLTLHDALRAAGPRIRPRGPGLERPLEEGALVVLGPGGYVRVGRMPGRRLLALGLPIPLARASAADLEALPGVGQVLAAKIIAYRDARGPIRSIVELAAVPGIGPKTLARIRPHLTTRSAFPGEEGARGHARRAGRADRRKAPTRRCPGYPDAPGRNSCGGPQLRMPGGVERTAPGGV